MNNMNKIEEKIRQHDFKVGNNILEVIYSPKGLRSFESGLMSLATTIAKSSEAMNGYLVIVDPKVTECRLKEEWAKILEPFRKDIKRRLHLVLVVGKKVEGLSENAEGELRNMLIRLVEEKDVAAGTRLLPKSNYAEILKILIYHWLNNNGPRTAKEIAAEAGCTYPTLSNSFARLSPWIKRGPKKSIELSGFPLDEWAKSVSQSDQQRSTIWFADRSGQPRTAESLTTRLRSLQLTNVAVGGVYGARFHFPAFNLIGNPQLTLSVHCTSSDADLRFIERLDPGLQRTRSTLEPSNLVLHFTRRTKTYYVSEPDGLNVADPVECLLDLHEARLESQALSFLKYLTSARSGAE